MTQIFYHNTLCNIKVKDSFHMQFTILLLNQDAGMTKNYSKHPE